MVAPQTHPIAGRIYEGLALSMHSQAWVSQAEEIHKDPSKPRLFPMHSELTDYCGAPTDLAWYAAANSIGKIEALNKESIVVTLTRASKADNCPIKEYPNSPEENEYAFDFGFALGLMVLGTGCSWFDGHEEFPLALPHQEFFYDGSEECFAKAASIT